MTKKKLMATLATVLSLSLLGGLMGCAPREQAAELPQQTAAAVKTQKEALTGVISIKVNPEIAVFYDEKGIVTSVEGRNDDGKKVITDYTGFTGKECRTVISELIARINEAGYFAEEIEGEPHQITLEIEKGSVLPTDNFLSAIVAEIQKYTSAEKINTPVAIDGESTYGWTDYGDTDYGPDNDGITDYGDTDYGTTGDGVTDYDDAAPAVSGNTGAADSGNSDYGNTDYGSGSDGVTDYDNGQSNYDDGKSNYDDGQSNYDDGQSNYDDGQSDYNAPQSTPAPAPEPTPAPQPSAPVQSGTTDYGDSGYDDGNSGYGDSDSGYDGGNSGYDDAGDSGYDDDGDSGYDD